MFLYQIALFSTCLGRALALSLPLTSTLSTLNGSLGALKPDCESGFYGSDLNVASCREAVDLMQGRFKVRTYVQRNTPYEGVHRSLPIRLLSCKSKCSSRDQRPI